MITFAQHLLVVRQVLKRTPAGRIATNTGLPVNDVCQIMTDAGFPDLQAVRLHLGQLVEVEREIRGVHARPTISVESLVRVGKASPRQRTRTLATRAEVIVRELRAELVQDERDRQAAVLCQL